MYMRWVVAAIGLSAIGFLATGCSSTQDSYRTISGQVDAQAYALDNATIVAHAANGKNYLAAVARNGRFSLSLPVGIKHSLAIANHTNTGSLREISLLTWHGTNARTRAILLSAGAAIDLGAIHPVGATAHVRNATTENPTATSTDEGAAASTEEASGDHKDCEDHENTTLCVDETHDDSEADNDQHDGLDCNGGGSEGGGSRNGGSKASDGTAGSGNLETATYGGDGAEHVDHGEDHSTMCAQPGGSADSGSDGGSGDGPTTTPTTGPSTPTPTGTGGDSGGAKTCLVNADCGANSICAESVCLPVVL